MNISDQRKGMNLSRELTVNGGFAGELGAKVFNYQGDFNTVEFLELYRETLEALKALGEGVVAIKALLPQMKKIEGGDVAIPDSIDDLDKA